jgi:hypothetical protein
MIHILVDASDIYILGGRVHTIKKYAKAFVVASKGIGLEVNDGKSKYVLVITNLMYKILFCNKFITCLYMFRALCAHHQEVKTVLYSLSKHVEACNKLTVKQDFVHQIG